MPELQEVYRHRYESVLKPLANAVEDHLKELLIGVKRIDRVTARAKAIDRFVGKAEKKLEGGQKKYSAPLEQILDQVGARIVTYYLSDVESVTEIITGYFNHIEAQVIEPGSDAEFGYIGKHFILLVPSELSAGMAEDDTPRFFELQIKTLFQHAWAEAEHDLGYKPGTPLDAADKKLLAFTAAQGWGADRIFEELFQKQAKVANIG